MIIRELIIIGVREFFCVQVYGLAVCGHEQVEYGNGYASWDPDSSVLGEGGSEAVSTVGFPFF